MKIITYQYIYILEIKITLIVRTKLTCIVNKKTAGLLKAAQANE